MIPQNELILLDTNVLIQLVRGNEIGRRIEANYQLRARPERPLISIITVGESYALVQSFGWGKSKVDQLKGLLRQLVVVDIHATVLDKYAEISHYLETSGQPIGQNDMWIAATSAASNSWLLTTDKDLIDYLQTSFVENTSPLISSFNRLIPPIDWLFQIG